MPSCSALGQLGSGVNAALALTFLIAGASKMFKPAARESAAAALSSLGIPKTLAGALAIVELGCGVWLASGFHHKVGVVIAVAVLGALTIGLGLLVSRGYAGSCGCFGLETSSRVNWADVGRNLVLLMLASGLLVVATECRFEIVFWSFRSWMAGVVGLGWLFTLHALAGQMIVLRARANVYRR